MIARVYVALTTAVLALVMAIAVPVAQLRTVEIDRTCCCPDPDECHCPGHDEHDDGAPAMESCHVTVVAIVAAGLPSFEPTVQPAVRAPDIAARVVHVTPASPHAPPVPDRPRGPS